MLCIHISRSHPCSELSHLKRRKRDVLPSPFCRFVLTLCHLSNVFVIIMQSFIRVFFVTRRFRISQRRRRRCWRCLRTSLPFSLFSLKRINAYDSNTGTIKETSENQNKIKVLSFDSFAETVDYLVLSMSKPSSTTRKMRYPYTAIIGSATSCRGLFLKTLNDTLGFSPKVNFNAGVVAAGEAQIESTVTGNSSDLDTKSSSVALQDQSQIYLPINNALSEAGHVYSFP